jgi:acyl-CoA synthetase (AMP-forming)/AMP-acid ligase II
MQITNIAAYLTAIAQAQPDRIALAVQQTDNSFREYSCQDLEKLTNRIVEVLPKVGIHKGTRTVVMVTPGLDFFAIVFALFRIGAVLVAVDPGMGIKNLKQCLAEAEPQAFIGNRKAHLARILFGWARSTLKTRISTETVFVPGIAHLQKLLAKESISAPTDAPETFEQEIAAILFTSGSTGVPKGVIYTHANFLAQVQALKTLYNIQAGEVDLATFPLFALYAPALAMTSIIPDMDFTRPGMVNPAKIFDAIHKYNVTTMFGSPALLDRVGRQGIKDNIRLPTLKRVLSAGAPVAPAIIERYGKLLGQDVQIYTPYGATETLPVSSIGSNEVLRDTRAGTESGKGICVGRPVAGIDVTIIAITNDPVPRWHERLRLEQGEIGEIVVRGPQVTAMYYNRTEATTLAKIYGDNGEVFHRMGDTGYLDEQGRLWFCGRKAHRVFFNGMTYYSICCEGVFNIHKQVYRTALIGLKQQQDTIPALCVEVEPEYLHTDINNLKNELLALGARYEHTRVIRDIFFHPGFPVDIRHNAKIDREALARWALTQKT